MRHGSLFSGIGGFDLAAEWMGWENVFQVEKDSFCQKVLAKNFPGTARYGDIKEFDGTKYSGAVDIISGGFPCQPFSVAGKRKGKEDDRFLWPEMLRIISEVRPSFIVGENVTGIIGMALEQVLVEVEAQGYKAETFIIPACGVNAPHRRDRVWIVAYRTSERCGETRASGTGQTERINGDGGQWVTTDTHSKGGIQLEQKSNSISNEERHNEIQAGGRETITNGATGRGGTTPNNNKVRCFMREPEGEGIQRQNETLNEVNPGFQRYWQDFPTESPVCRADDGIPNRVDRIKALGNAIVPQVAYEIFKAIESVLSHDNKSTSPAVTLPSEVEKENTQVRNNQKFK